MIGRLRPGTSPQAAALELDAIHQRQDPGRFFQWAREGEIRLASIDADDSGSASAESSIVRLLLAVVGLVLVIAWTNVVNLLLARMTRRRNELMVRLALGIGRWRLFRLLLIESLLLGAGGGLLSLPVAYGEALLVRWVLLPDIAWPTSLLDTRMLIAVAVIALVSGVVIGLLPARHVGRLDLSARLATGRGSPGCARLRTQTLLGTAQVTLAASLMLCAGLSSRAFGRFA